MYKTGRKTFVDSIFFMVPDPLSRLYQYQRLYTAVIGTQVLQILLEEDVDDAYIVFEPKKSYLYPTKSLRFVRDKKCFKKVYDDNDINIYHVVCSFSK